MGLVGIRIEETCTSAATYWGKYEPSKVGPNHSKQR